MGHCVCCGKELRNPSPDQDACGSVECEVAIRADQATTQEYEQSLANIAAAGVIIHRSAGMTPVAWVRTTTDGVKQLRWSKTTQWEYATKEDALYSAETVSSALAELLEAARQAVEFVGGYEDIRDGDYGQPSPNRAMQVATLLRAAIAKATGE